MMKQINLNGLTVFAAAAKYGNLQRAAETLNLSRGAVSQRIKALEIELGTVLLERQARGVSLTPAGARWKTAVDEALAVLETAIADIEDGEDHMTLHLGSSTAAKWLMPRIERLEAQFPKLSFGTEVHDRMLARSLGRNEIAIWPGKVPDQNPVHQCRTLTEIRLVAVCSPDFMCPDRPMELGTLLALPLLQDAHGRWERLIEETGHTAHRRLRNFDRSALALDAAIQGHGVAMAPSYMIEGDLRAGRLVELWVDPDPPQQRLFVSWSAEHIRQHNVGRVVDWITSQFERDQPDA
ncbi:MAG: LysR family transcriptional regulator [Pseudomonadota bacterium]